MNIAKAHAILRLLKDVSVDEGDIYTKGIKAMSRHLVNEGRSKEAVELYNIWLMNESRIREKYLTPLDDNGKVLHEHK